jgi:hypothetical protein
MKMQKRAAPLAHDPEWEGWNPRKMTEKETNHRVIIADNDLHDVHSF